jgi:hypothetical protein
MKVYILTGHWDYEDTIILKVFKNQKDAEIHKKWWEDHSGTEINGKYISHYDSWYIEEWEVI